MCLVAKPSINSHVKEGRAGEDSQQMINTVRTEYFHSRFPFSIPGSQPECRECSALTLFGTTHLVFSPPDARDPNAGFWSPHKIKTWGWQEGSEPSLSGDTEAQLPTLTITRKTVGGCLRVCFPTDSPLQPVSFLSTGRTGKVRSHLVT